MLPTAAAVLGVHGSVRGQGTVAIDIGEDEGRARFATGACRVFVVGFVRRQFLANVGWSAVGVTAIDYSRMNAQ